MKKKFFAIKRKKTNEAEPKKEIKKKIVKSVSERVDSYGRRVKVTTYYRYSNKYIEVDIDTDDISYHKTFIYSKYGELLREFERECVREAIMHREEQKPHEEEEQQEEEEERTRWDENADDTLYRNANSLAEEFYQCCI